jgi:hypothetical protein
MIAQLLPLLFCLSSSCVVLDLPLLLCLSSSCVVLDCPFCFVCLRPVSFLIAPSVLHRLSIRDCFFGFPGRRQTKQKGQSITTQYEDRQNRRGKSRTTQDEDRQNRRGNQERHRTKTEKTEGAIKNDTGRRQTKQKGYSRTTQDEDRQMCSCLLTLLLMACICLLTVYFIRCF